MTIKFVLLVNKQGQTRLAKYTDSSLTTDERRALEAEIVRKCLTRVDKQVGPGQHITGAKTGCGGFTGLLTRAGRDAAPSKQRRKAAVPPATPALGAFLPTFWSLGRALGPPASCPCCSATSWSIEITRWCTGGTPLSSSSWALMPRR